MEATTPPNATGFVRKPKNRKRIDGRKSTVRKSGFNPFAGISEKEQAWLLGSMFLFAAAKLLGPAIGFDAAPPRNTEIADA